MRKYSINDFMSIAQKLGYNAVQVTNINGDVLAEMMGTKIRPTYLFPNAKLFDESFSVWGFTAWQTLPCDITAQVMGRLKVCLK